MATFKTRRQFIDRVLDQLGVLVPGQAPSDEMVAKVDQILDPAFELVAADEIYLVQDPGTENPPTGGEINNAVYLPLADCVAWRIAGSFNLVGDPALYKMNEEAEETLKRIGRPAPTRKTLSTDPILRAGNRRRRTINYTTGV